MAWSVSVTRAPTEYIGPRRVSTTAKANIIGFRQIRVQKPGTLVICHECVAAYLHRKSRNPHTNRIPYLIFYHTTSECVLGVSTILVWVTLYKSGVRRGISTCYRYTIYVGIGSFVRGFSTKLHETSITNFSYYETS